MKSIGIMLGGKPQNVGETATTPTSIQYLTLAT